MAKELELPQQTLKKQTPQALALPRKYSDIGLPALPSSSYPVFSSCLPVAVTHNLVPFFGSLYSLFSPLKCNLQREAFPEHPNLKWPSNPSLDSYHPLHSSSSHPLGDCCHLSPLAGCKLFVRVGTSVCPVPRVIFST